MAIGACKRYEPPKKAAKNVPCKDVPKNPASKIRLVPYKSATKEDKSHEASKVEDPAPVVELPEKALRIIFLNSNLLEKDLCTLARVCKRFYSIANSSERWRRLYYELFQYDMPLMQAANPRRFYFVKNNKEDSGESQDSTTESAEEPADSFPGMQIEPWVMGSLVTKQRTRAVRWKRLSQESLQVLISYGSHSSWNAWKESFSQLYHAVHVRPGYTPKHERGTKYFTTIREAVEWCKKSKNLGVDKVPIILIHPGTYYDDCVCTDLPIILLGCGPGSNPAENVVIETYYNDACITFKEAKGASYLGYVTVRNSCREKEAYASTWDSFRPPTFKYCVRIMGKAASIIDHCIIQSPQGNGIRAADSAKPTVRHCDITEIGGIGVDIAETATGVYEQNKISRCTRAFRVKDLGRTTVRKNTFEKCLLLGMVTTNGGRTYRAAPWDS